MEDRFNDPDGGPPVLRVLVVDGDLGHRKLLCALVGRFGDEAVEAGDGREGLEKARRLKPEIVIAACRCGGLPGIELVRSLRELPDGQPFVIVALHPDEQGDLAAAIASGADDWITKPISQEAVLARLQIARRIVQAQADNARLTARLRSCAEELAQLDGRVHRLSQTDELTGLPNWSFANRQLQDIWAEPGPLSCLVIDIDDFRKLNHAWGREKGNEVLRTVAVAIGGVLGGRQVLCRFGGDRFLAICPETPLATALGLGSLILERVGALGIRAAGMPLGVSIGAAERRGAMAGPAELVGLAERGMEQAKFNGRNRVLSGHEPLPAGEGPSGGRFLGAA